MLDKAAGQGLQPELIVVKNTVVPLRLGLLAGINLILIFNRLRYMGLDRVVIPVSRGFIRGGDD